MSEIDITKVSPELIDSALKLQALCLNSALSDTKALTEERDAAHAAVVRLEGELAEAERLLVKGMAAFCDVICDSTGPDDECENNPAERCYHAGDMGEITAFLTRYQEATP